MLKILLKRIFTVFILILTITTTAHASDSSKEEGTVIYHVKYDYDEISKFLRMSREEYEQKWNQGLSIFDMAKEQGIERREVEGYFYTFHYEEMQKWRKEGPLTEKHYFHLVYNLAEEIEDFIDRNPNK
ncbi:hypothetical protein [Psychrobacillus sp. FSL K6-2843]|jgi:hypothetical protein|uniref:hypothetical protein n=1 Tax=Psychrobacillus sp. FSL K6-2843 TaxID=2921549 RepID=UPI00315AED37